MSVGSVEERIVFFPCGKDDLAGILSIPRRPNGRTVLIPWGAGAFPSSGRNRLRTRLARRLAEEGFHAFRFDYLGVAESEGEYRPPDMDRPNTEEIIAAAAWLSLQGLDRVTIVTNCFGGWSSLMAAPMIPGLEGIAAVNPPVGRDHDQVRARVRSWRWWLKKIRKLTLAKLLNSERRARYRKLVSAKAMSLVRAGADDSRFAEAIMYLLNQGIPTLLIYGSDGFRSDFEAESLKDLRAAIEKAGPRTRLVMAMQPLSACASLEAQELLLKEVLPWLLESIVPSN